MKRFLVSLALLIFLTTPALALCQSASISTTRAPMNYNDDCMFGSAETGEVCDLNWSVSGGTAAPISGVPQHFGLSRISTGATINTVVAMHQNSAATTGAFALRRKFKVGGEIRTVTNGVQELRLGLSRSALTAPPTHGIFFELDTAAAVTDDQTAFVCVTRRNSTSTRTNTGVTVEAGGWYHWQIERVSDETIKFYLNGKEACSHGTVDAPDANQPVGFMSAMLQIENLEAADKSFDFDRFFLYVP